MKFVKRESEQSALRKDFSHAFSDLYNRFFDDDFFSTDLARTDWNPRVDVFEKDNSVVVKADIPGIEEKNLNVELEGNVLTISGEKQEEHKTDSKNYRHMERSYGSFTRRITLPDNIQQEKVNADYTKGVLTVTIPKSKENGAKKISVKVS